MRTTFITRFDSKTRCYIGSLFSFSVGLMLGSVYLSKTDTNTQEKLNTMVTDIFGEVNTGLWQNYKTVFSVYFAAAVVLMLMCLSLYPVLGNSLFFVGYGVGTSVVLRTTGDKWLFLLVVLVPVLITAVTCYIILAEMVVSGKLKGKITSKTAVKSFYITAVLGLISLYYCGIKTIIL